ncbi:MAG: leucine-rich repeat protein [Spirochaetes bacterium]|nr:leucine-rich repeat protein [Spirochaetota bacterium]
MMINPLRKRSVITAMFFSLCILFFSCVSPPSEREAGAEVGQRQAGPYFIGDGGRGIILAVLEPSGEGLLPNEQWLPSLIQGSITGDFNRYSAMTIVDRQNLETIIAEQIHALSGYYFDEDVIRIGRLTNARYILTGSLSRVANNYWLELSVTDVESGVRRASFSPRPVTLAELTSLSVVKEASADLLRQLGVTLTDAGLAALKRPVAPLQIQAETALARGIVAQRQGTEVAALSYYFQAAALNPSLFEAVNRSSVMSARITSGNLGVDVRNDIQWRRDWIAKLTETEEFFYSLFQNTALAYTLFYSTELEQGIHDWENETATLNINTKLYCSWLWADSAERALQTIYDGLTATGRKETWGLADWPRQSLGSQNPFDIMTNLFYITVELINDQDQVIGTESFTAGGAWAFNLTGRPEIVVLDNVKQTVSIRGINIDNITDDLTIRIARVNAYSARGHISEAELPSIVRTQTGNEATVLRIRALTGDEWRFNNSFIMDRGTIIRFTGERGSFFSPISITIDTVWDDPVISIGRFAFRNLSLNNVTFGDSVTYIGEGAFSDNMLQNIIIGNGVTTIGRSAFHGNSWKESIVIPDSVRRIGNRAFCSSFADNATITIGPDVSIGNFIDFSKRGGGLDRNRTTFPYNRFIYLYYRNERRAGTYTYNWRWNRWTVEHRDRGR